jgi:hypothetical protein
MRFVSRTRQARRRYARVAGFTFAPPKSSSDRSLVVSVRSPASRFALSLLLSFSGMVTMEAESERDFEFFESRIRPLLADRCMDCHGEKKKKGGLRLDSRAAWQKGGESGAVIVPGDPEASLLIKAVRYADKDLQMPPKRQLTAEEVAALEHWVKIGAPDPRDGSLPVARKGVDFAEGRKQWAFQPVGNPQPPKLAHDPWSRTELDRFIFARLQQAGLQPGAQADRRTLIRRATFDLTGLPPTFEETDAFVRDASPDAFAKVVDRLLASQHYGEHWARHWLDVARYSDTKGYVYAREEKQFVGAWPYRDWVVRALNDDMPYDRFLLLQLAADQVEPAGSPNLAAMGFLTLGRRFLGVTHDIIDDRIDVVMRGTQALTVACARCHDHKFDPISLRDYYALYGVFQSCAEKVVACAVPTTDVAFEKELRAREEKLNAMMTQRREEQAARVRATLTEHLVAQFELEKYPEETFTQIISAADINPVFVRRWQRFLADAEQHRDPLFAAWHEFAKLRPADFATLSEGAVQKLQKQSVDTLNPLVARAFVTAPTTMRDVAQRYGALFADVEKQWRAFLKTNPDAKALPDENAEALRCVLYGPDSPCTVPDEHLANNEWFFPTSTVVELWKLQGEVDRWLAQSATAPAHATILVDRAKPSTPRIFKRGNPLTKGEEVPRQFLQVLAGDSPKPFVKGSGRLELAQAITAPDNPLTARVIVNRVWMQHFGCGLVTTPSDFGKRADPPSHPELLNWLTRCFMDEGWSLKKLHRRILLSATYQQSSLAPTDAVAARKAQELDPDNRLLWRMNTHRLTFEEMRDAWLATTGELDLRVGGKPVELFAGNNARRTLYARVDRERLPTVMRTFDFANPDLSIPQRNDTIVPQQALFGLNHPFLATRAKALVRRTESADNENTARVRRLYELLFQRKSTELEMAAALAFVQPEAALIAKRESPNAWHYGYGEWDQTAGRIKSFTTLPLFNGTAWQGGDQWPDKKLGWAQLTATGGHPGNDRQHAVVRRWVAPQDGSYSIASTLIHEPAVGDGIRAFISHSGRGLLRSTVLHHSTEAVNLDAIPMCKGDTLDFIVDIRDGLNSDQFLWSPKILAAANGGAGGNAQSWDAQKDFTGPAAASLNLWQQLAQTLMLTNEFVFVD